VQVGWRKKGLAYDNLVNILGGHGMGINIHGFIFYKQQERMWNSFQGDRESGLFWLLSESIEKD
jgi:hypothetical protein